MTLGDMAQFNSQLRLQGTVTFGCTSCATPNDVPIDYELSGQMGANYSAVACVNCGADFLVMIGQQAPFAVVAQQTSDPNA